MNNNFSDMDRVNRIWRHPVYQEHYKKIQELESERIFCRHTPEHFLDVARLMYIYALARLAWIENLEQQLGLEKEHVYAAALLHDIGRAQQYQYNIPHDIAGVEIAREILTDLHFTHRRVLCRNLSDFIFSYFSALSLYLEISSRYFFPRALMLTPFLAIYPMVMISSESSLTAQ